MNIDELIKEKDLQLEVYLGKIKDSSLAGNKENSGALHDKFGNFLCDSVREFQNARKSLEKSDAMADNPFIGNLSRYLSEKEESYGKVYKTLARLQEEGSVPTDIDWSGP
ncbi:hypothetical protein HN747_03965, partial [archaeon]|jgi:hypothetical protein|nr:hypothetical protein [archaeon]